MSKAPKITETYLITTELADLGESLEEQRVSIQVLNQYYRRDESAPIALFVDLADGAQDKVLEVALSRVEAAHLVQCLIAAIESSNSRF